MSQVVYVGLSGGVDSAVSAALLKRQGNRVVGVFIKIWRPEFRECTWEKDRVDAMRVAVALKIPFKEVDLSEEYERSVVREMTAAYEAGVTPNPDVSCNEKIKFGSFYEWALSDGAELVATGHYARVEERGGQHVLLRGIDRAKDQSYFLYRIPRERLANVVFPIGAYAKDEVRALARRLDLPVAHKHDSQGLCFVGDVSMRDFLSRYIPVREGPVIDAQGKIIGTHGGAALYTIGQRHGFSATGGPHYVRDIDAATNTLTVASRPADCARAEVRLRDVHWLATVDLPRTLHSQSRYHGVIYDARVEHSHSGYKVEFNEPQLVSPGQSVVLYDNDACLGGGSIA